MAFFELKEVLDEEHQIKQDVIKRWLNYNLTNTYIELRLGKINVFEYIRNASEEVGY